MPVTPEVWGMDTKGCWGLLTATKLQSQWKNLFKEYKEDSDRAGHLMPSLHCYDYYEHTHRHTPHAQHHICSHLYLHTHACARVHTHTHKLRKCQVPSSSPSLFSQFVPWLSSNSLGNRHCAKDASLFLSCSRAYLYFTEGLKFDLPKITQLVKRYHCNMCVCVCVFVTSNLACGCHIPMKCSGDAKMILERERSSYGHGKPFEVLTGSGSPEGLSRERHGENPLKMNPGE